MRGYFSCSPKLKKKKKKSDVNCSQCDFYYHYCDFLLPHATVHLQTLCYCTGMEAEFSETGILILPEAGCRFPTFLHQLNTLTINNLIIIDNNIQYDCSVADKIPDCPPHSCFILSNIKQILLQNIITACPYKQPVCWEVGPISTCAPTIRHRFFM